jgi:hyperosmotically inducible protein
MHVVYERGVITNAETVTPAGTTSIRTAGACILLGVSVGLFACGHARPDGAMERAARGQEDLASKLEDRAMKAEMLANLMEDRAVAGAHVRPYVYMGHAFLVGSVKTSAQRDAAIADAWKVQGVRSVEAYLPAAARGKRSASKTGSDRALETELERKLSLDPALTTRVHLQMVDGHAVLLGVVPSREAVQSAATIAQGTNGIAGVTNFLLVPEEHPERGRSGPMESR